MAPPGDNGDRHETTIQEDAAAVAVRRVEANIRARFKALAEERRKAHVAEGWDDHGNFGEYEDEDETEEERVARLEAEELERQISQKKRTLDSLVASQKAAKYC